MGERRLRASREAGLTSVPGDGPGHRRRRHAAGRAAGEPAPLRAEPARGGGGVPAAAGRLRRHARGAGRADRPLAAAGQQHDAAARPAPAVQRRVAAGVLCAGHARALLALEDAGAQDAMRQPDRRRGLVGPGDGGGRAPRRRGRDTPAYGGAARRRRSRPGPPRSPSSWGVARDPGPRGEHAAARAGSSSSTARRTISSASPTCSSPATATSAPAAPATASAT